MRIFKTRWFNREAKSYTIKDDELSEAINAVLQGKADNLGDGVYKKRLNQNRDRAIVLAKHYACLTEDQITALINNKELVEVRHVSKN
ncbi:type II toxin-antitoxin system RelE/ParE family toxin [Salmonella enterica subsp. enterica serovar Portland]|uniref:type II toxin-antitoxin system RelE/ParE family toxin n=1 Tax=Salmonella enterica TaxID=28901 RepID=UPI00127E7CB0|nr:type II toxin-antitoxin system RelE/ParE family toxin [Salmonella enterica]ECA8971579.1 type II toxin-antitoxin system RelE/ParE family toxin [Salmonella enterica subsp. enterica serovar Omuna]ECI3849534.1 type II toxin-antitoxin system RelE/ParE family toxin [Salmonella enterica subsp. enterica]EEB9698119.1 type II toxin-antitoxin system RelE/ParE family toxin [Salmonella enterica subsp. enterica serovar Miami]EGZ4348592.1 type II toxin-antitoxin system RelE/ParE family toxin [Salmonella en